MSEASKPLGPSESPASHRTNPRPRPCYLTLGGDLRFVDLKAPIQNFVIVHSGRGCSGIEEEDGHTNALIDNYNVYTRASASPSVISSE